MRIFVRAGRDPNIQALQLKLAANELRQVLETSPLVQSEKLPFPRMRGAKSIGHAGQHTRAGVLSEHVYAEHVAKAYVGAAVAGLQKRFGVESTWPANWGAQFLADYESLFKTSGVACWGTRPASKTECSKRRSRYVRTLVGLAYYAP